MAGLCGEASPSVDFTHGNLARSQQQTEQHGGGFSAGSQAFSLNPARQVEKQNAGDESCT
jgi:hypothetical protein